MTSVWEKMGITPRDWQRKAVPIGISAIRERKPSIVQAVMGAGKSIFISAIVVELLSQCETIVITAPRKKLVKQLSSTLEGFTSPFVCGRYFGECKEPQKQIIVACDASTEKLASELQHLGRRVDLWIADECHGSEAQRMKEWCEVIQPTARLGLTATPRRASDEETLSLWEEEIFRYDTGDALRDGVVVPLELMHWEGDPETTVNQAICKMLPQVIHLGPGIVDSDNIEDAESFCEYLQRNSIKADVVHSRLNDKTIEERLERLRVGELEVLVHVTLLKEGVDLPWLRWMALRRDVGSKVHFAQHVGRVLRAFPGKEKAIVLDPLDLFAKHKLNLDAILQGGVVEEEPVEVEEDLAYPTTEPNPEPDPPPQREDEEPYSMLGGPVFVKQFQQDTSLLRKLCVQMEIQGHVECWKGTRWRQEPITEKQIRMLRHFGKKLKTYIDYEEELAPLLRRMYAQRYRLTKGQASDLISLFKGIIEKHRKIHQAKLEALLKQFPKFPALELG